MDIRIFPFFFIFLFCSCNQEEQKAVVHPFENRHYLELLEVGKESQQLDSINELLIELENDSLINSLYFKYAYYSLKNGDSKKFRYWNRKAFIKSIKINDTLKIAEAHWDLASYFLQDNLIDSSYYNYNKAFLFYDAGKEEFLSGMMLLNMAILQKNIKDYAGSEVTTIKAINKIKKAKNKSQLYKAYNNLGIIYKELGDYKKALEYHGRALEFHLISGNLLLQASSLNNIGNIYKEDGYFDEAIEKYQTALQVDSIEIKRPQLYAMLLDNRAHARLKKTDTVGIFSDFLEALQIREKINHESGIVVNKIHLSEYYLFKKDSLKALKYASQALALSEQTSNHRDILNSMLLLAEIDINNEGYFLRKHIELSDSLQNKERRVRNKFARIHFETDEFIAKNKQLNEQKKWLIGGSSGALILSFLAIIIFRQKAKHRKLKNERDQQKANEEIYRLLLDQENKIEDGKYKEKERISKELHDGVLSKLFGIRFTLSNLNLKCDQDSIKIKEKHLDDLRQMEQEIRLISHELQNNKFQEVGFLKLLRKLLEDQAMILGFLPTINSDPSIPWERISNPIKMNLYRIIQEAFQNIKRYSGASKAEIKLILKEECLIISINDNGRGFDIDKKVQGIGLANMRSRTKEIGGSFYIKSGKMGTLITIKISI
ncbi:tetratricopeptide repeat protein [Salegentibacter sp. JZCK2]|uniref:ATP-binding protein n=1 Tax=Salegentibacter tibetensis TaxID=2873600 RepID=UPI001CCCA40C|nr:tetratricopeptide repeat-containing sensor histidine kinase [Salegentibacter tibetensis]MBZ9731165.1 tetratricopeptide repeat protein [Salegentibacter tibetensis]